MTYWFYLLGAILFEVAGTISMKLSNGFSHVLYSILIFVFYVISFTLLTFAIKKIDLSIAYAVWAGLGTILITLVGIYWFKEGAGTVKLLSIALIIIGVVGLKLTSDAH